MNQAKGYFIATDERTGCTEFTASFRACGLSCIDDPQTVISIPTHSLYNKLVQITGTTNRHDIDTWIPRVLNAYDVIKICFVSYSVKEYIKILDYADNMGFKIIVVHRNSFKRAISLEIAKELTRQTKALKDSGKLSSNVVGDGYSNSLFKEWKPFTIDPKAIELEIHRYMDSITQVLEWLDCTNRKYYFLQIEHLHAQMSVKSYETIFATLGLKVQDFTSLSEVINYRPLNKKNLVLNFDELSSKILVTAPTPKNAINLL